MELSLVVLVLLVFGVLFWLFNIWTKKELSTLKSRESVPYPKGKPEPLRRLVRVYKTEKDYVLGKMNDEVRDRAIYLTPSSERHMSYKKVAYILNRLEYSSIKEDPDYIPRGEYSFPAMLMGGVLNPVKNSVEFDTEHKELNNSFEITYADPNLRSLEEYYATEMLSLSH